MKRKGDMHVAWRRSGPSYSRNMAGTIRSITGRHVSRQRLSAQRHERKRPGAIPARRNWLVHRTVRRQMAAQRQARAVPWKDCRDQWKEWKWMR